MCHAGVVRGGCETDEQRHETEQAGDEPFVALAPVEGILLVAGGIVEDDVLDVIVEDAFGQRQWQVEVDFLQGYVTRDLALVIAQGFEVFASRDLTLRTDLGTDVWGLSEGGGRVDVVCILSVRSTL